MGEIGPAFMNESSQKASSWLTVMNCFLEFMLSSHFKISLDSTPTDYKSTTKSEFVRKNAKVSKHKAYSIAK
jgi:hypothetical protein